MKLKCFDLKSSNTSNGIKLKALTRYGIEVMPRPFDPYCYVKSKDFDIFDAESHGLSVASGSPDNFVKLKAEHPSAIKRFSKSVNYQTFEADVWYETRVAIDEDIKFIRPEAEDILFFDIEVSDRGQFTEPEAASSRVISIAGIDATGNEHYFDDEDEEQLLRGFFKAAADYPVLVGWNSLDYDFRYLKNRTEKVGFRVNWDKFVCLDLMPLYDALAIPTKKVSLKLDDVGNDELNFGKTNVQAGGGTLRDLWENDPDKLEKYNLRDCEILRQLDEKYGLVELLYVICNLCNYPPGSTCYLDHYDKPKFGIGSVVDAKLLEVAKRRGIPQPNRGDFDKPKDFPGAYVLNPKQGLYENVVVPDYSGMYPNIVRAFNFGRETWYQTKEELYDAHGTSAKVINAETGFFVHPDDGGRSVPAEAADELIQMRDDASEIVDKGIKAVNNTLYGVFAADFHRYFGPHSENITLIGQELTRVVERLAESGRHIEQVIYGDTDSVMLEMKQTDNPIKTAHKIAESLETEMQKWADSRNAQSEYLTLDVDDVYDRFYIGDKKKRYFGHRIYDGSKCDNIKVRGFETRQHNWPEPVREMQKKLMLAVLEDDGVIETIQSYREALFEGELDSRLATKTTLTKPISAYNGKSAHVTAAKQLKEEGYVVEVGDKVGYIKYGKGADKVTWAIGDELGRELRPHDYEYIWRKKFESVMDSIDVSEFEQTSLGAFA